MGGLNEARALLRYEKNVLTDPLRFVQARVASKSREQLIGELAYLKALARGFEPGHAVDGWVSAENEIDRQRHTGG